MNRIELPLARHRFAHLAAYFSQTPWQIAAILTALAATILVIGARFADPRMSVTPADLTNHRSLVRFYQTEQNDTDTYRWSEPQAAVFFYGFEGRTIMAGLRLTAPRQANTPPPLTKLNVQGRAFGAFAVLPGWRRYHVLFPSAPAGETPLVLNTDPAPPIAGEQRELGLVLSHVNGQPATGADSFAFPRRAVFLLGLILLLWMLLQRFHALAAFLIGLAGAGVAGWAMAFPLISEYWLPTWHAWWLPFVALVWLALPLRNLLPAGIPLMPWGGLALGLAALAALRLGVDPTLAIAGLIIGTFLALTGVRDQRPVPEEQLSAIGRFWEPAALLVITALALGLRFYQLDTLPLGLWRDEARHGMLAQMIWQDSTFRPVYVVAGADLPALLFYLMAPIIGWFGPHAWSVRFVSALAGALTPLALWWAVRPLIGARAATLAAALIAWASWSLSMSRWAFPATLDHLLMLVALGLMLRALHLLNQPPATAGIRTTPFQWRPLILMALASFCAALAAYAYHTGRMEPLTLAVLTALRLGPAKTAWKRTLPALAVAAMIGVLTLVPLARFILADTEGYNRRVASVSIMNDNNLEVHSPLMLLLRNMERYLQMWHVRGEPNGRHHAPGAPMLDPVAGLLMLLGLGLTVIRPGTWRIIPVWLALSLIPGLFSTDAPHAMRSLGALAPACALAGLALDALLRRLESAHYSLASSVVPLGITLACSLAFNSWLYYADMPRNPDVYEEFDVESTAMGRVVRLAADSTEPALQDMRVFVPEDKRQDDVLRFLTGTAEVGYFDGTRLSAPPGNQAILLLPPDATPEMRAAALAALGPGATSLAPLPAYPRGERPLFLAYGVGPEAGRLLHLAFP